MEIELLVAFIFFWLLIASAGFCPSSSSSNSTRDRSTLSSGGCLRHPAAYNTLDDSLSAIFQAFDNYWGD